MTTPADVVARLADENIEFVEFRFTDVPGLQHHYTLPSHELHEGVFEEGLGFDGSSIRGFQTIDRSDMLLVPDPEGGFVDPFYKHSTLVLHCTVYDPVTGYEYFKDPRVFRQAGAALHARDRAGRHLLQSAPRPSSSSSTASTTTTSPTGPPSRSAPWRASGRAVTPSTPATIRTWGHRIRYKSGYFPLPPMDRPPGPARRDGVGAGGLRRGGRTPPSRGRDRRSGRDRHALRRPAGHGRQGAALQDTSARTWRTAPRRR